MTHVLVLLVHFYWGHKLSSKLTMDSTRGERTVIGIGKTVERYKNIAGCLLAGHGLSGCDTVSHYNGISLQWYREENSSQKKWNLQSPLTKLGTQVLLR